MRLREIQMRMAAAIMTPLTSQERADPKLAKAAGGLLKPNDHLSSLERLEIYSRSYWFRVLDALRDDFPGLIAILGADAFDRMAAAYLSDCPSRSFTLRDLGSRLPEWLERNPEYAGRNRQLTYDMVRLEWAHIVSFDGATDTILDPEHLLEAAPALRIGVQPYITLLRLHYPVDELRVGLKTTPEESAGASNFAVKKKTRAVAKFARLKPETIFLAVHRMQTSVYYRRLHAEEFRLLTELRAGRSIAGAINTAFAESSITRDEIPGLLQVWFATWAQLGWLSVPKGTKGSKHEKSN